MRIVIEHDNGDITTFDNNSPMAENDEIAVGTMKAEGSVFYDGVVFPTTANEMLINYVNTFLGGKK